jgi:hypothetical protein
MANIFNNGLAPSSGGHCNTDMYGNCNNPLGPDIMIVPAAGTCTDLVPLSNVQQHNMIMASVNMNNPRNRSKNGIVNYVKTPWSGVL